MNKQSKVKLQHYREKIAGEYRDRITALKEENKRLAETTKRLTKENYDLELKLHDAESKLEQYEDWIQRMQEYTNMSDEELEVVKKKLKLEATQHEALERAMDVVVPMMEAFFGMK